MSDLEGYGLEPKFEVVVLHYCCSRPSFWKRVGGELDPKRMGHELAPFILAACRLITKETGRPPSSPLLVVQRAARWNAEGKVKKEVVAAISDLFDAAEDIGLPPEDEVVAELVPVVRRRIHSEAVMKAHDEFAKRGDFSDVVSTIRKASTLGEVIAVEDVSLSHKMLGILDADGIPRLRTPIVELSVALEGGLKRGGEGVVIAESGGGKSIYLVSQVAESSRNGLHVCFATLELPYKEQFARLVANMTGIPTNDLQLNKEYQAKAAKILEQTAAQRGPVHVAEFTPYATTVRDLIDWIDQKEQIEGKKVDVLVVDYGDKLWDPRAKDGNEYIAMRYVFEGLRRDVAVERDMWVWTAAQPGRRSRKESKAFLDLADVSDSMHKIRAADLVVTINFEDLDDYSEATYFVPKHRGSKARMGVGPLPTDFSCARICALVPF